MLQTLLRTALGPHQAQERDAGLFGRVPLCLLQTLHQNILYFECLCVPVLLLLLAELI